MVCSVCSCYLKILLYILCKILHLEFVKKKIVLKMVWLENLIRPGTKITFSYTESFELRMRSEMQV